MPNTVFAFKQFIVKQDRSPMKISTDSVLVGAWPEVDKAKTILDIGTGTGIISLMLAQRSDAFIDAIDIDADACMQAIENFSASKWNNRLRVTAASVQDYDPGYKYDVIVSNPPYFPLPSTFKATRAAVARYTQKLSFDELADSVLRLLTPRGAFYVIFPVHEGAYFTNEAEQKGLFLTDYIWIKTTANKKFPKRIMMKFERSARTVDSDRVITIQDEDGFSSEYKALTRQYYLKF